MQPASAGAGCSCLRRGYSPGAAGHYGDFAGLARGSHGLFVAGEQVQPVICSGGQNPGIVTQDSS